MKKTLCKSNKKCGVLSKSNEKSLTTRNSYSLPLKFLILVFKNNLNTIIFCSHLLKVAAGAAFPNRLC